MRFIHREIRHYLCMKSSGTTPVYRPSAKTQKLYHAHTYILHTHIYVRSEKSRKLYHVHAHTKTPVPALLFCHLPKSSSPSAKCSLASSADSVTVFRCLPLTSDTSDYVNQNSKILLSQNSECQNWNAQKSESHFCSPCLLPCHLPKIQNSETVI